jgi:hypothetical protein
LGRDRSGAGHAENDQAEEERQKLAEGDA